MLCLLLHPCDIMRGGLGIFFKPRSVAIIGASREEDKPGHVILSILLEYKKRGVFKGDIYPVNPRADRILGVKSFSSVAQISAHVDLAIIVVPAQVVPEVMEECGRKGVRGAIIISAGFSEIGNRELEESVVGIARKYGIRVLGPNCIGVLVPSTGMDTIFLPTYKILRDNRKVLSTPRPKPGYVALLSQSGAFGTAAIDYMAGEGIGLSAFVSYGNKADVDEADLLEYFGEDENTRVILMYIESLEEGRKVVEIASRVSLEKPIVALKTGRTKAGARAAASHTAALVGVDEIYSAAFRRAGIIRAYDLEELFDMAKALVLQPPSRGPRIAIVTDGGGAGVMATDMAEILELEVPELGGQTRKRLEELRDSGGIPRYSSISNPIDLTGSATSEMYVEVIKILMDSREVDMIVVLALHHIPGIEDPTLFAEDIGRVVREYKFAKPVLAVDTGSSEAAVLERRKFDEMLIPSYPTPERAIKASRALAEYGTYLRKKDKFREYIEKWTPAL